MSIAEKLQTIKENESKVYEAGQKAEYDRFWDCFQDNGNRKDYRLAFFGNSWNDELFKPKYDISLNATRSEYYNTQTFEYSGITDLSGVRIISSGAEWLNGTFRYATITNMDLDVSSCVSMPMTFYAMEKLKTLSLRNLRADCNFDRTITFCYALENLSITGTIGTGSGGNSSINLQYSTKLTHESLMNIIGCLKDFREIIVNEKAVNGTTKLSPSHTLTDGDKYTLTIISDDGGTETASGTVGDVYVPTLGETKKGVEFIFSQLYEGEASLAWIYQNDENLMFTMYFGRENPKITLIKSPTETHSIILGTTNLAKLTDAEKAVAAQKGWSLL